jgi:hypothetical protein
MAKCILCGREMATIKAQSNKKGEPIKYGLFYSCLNKKCADYKEHYVRSGYPSDKRVDEVRSHRKLPYRE